MGHVSCIISFIILVGETSRAARDYAACIDLNRLVAIASALTKTCLHIRLVLSLGDAGTVVKAVTGSIWYWVSVKFCLIALFIDSIVPLLREPETPTVIILDSYLVFCPTYLC